MPSSAPSLARTLAQHTRDGELYERLSRAALEHALAHFDEDRVIGELKGLYRGSVTKIVGRNAAT
jgi:hypothetical protein